MSARRMALHDELSVPALVLRHPQEDVQQFLHIISADAVNEIRIEP